MSFRVAAALQLIERALTRGRLGHAYLITGPKEADLEGFAAKFMNAVSHEDHGSLDEWKEQDIPVLRPESKSRRIVVGGKPGEMGIRDMERKIHLSAGPGGLKFAVIVDADRMTEQAQNSFLKTLEEPPPRTLLLLLTSKPQQLLTTILSRVIQIPLMPEAGSRKFSGAEMQLLQLLSNLTARGDGGLSVAMTIRREFEDLLSEVKERITKELEDDLDREKELYQKTTDGQWLKQREEEVDANISAQYSQERETLMELLLSWMGDVLRHQVGAERLDIPDFAVQTAALAERWDQAAVSRRLKELRRLQTNLHTNVNEALALDVAFTAAFA